MLILLSAALSLFKSFVLCLEFPHSYANKKCLFYCSVLLYLSLHYHKHTNAFYYLYFRFYNAFSTYYVFTNYYAG